MFKKILTKTQHFSDEINNNGVNNKWNRKTTLISENWEKVKKKSSFSFDRCSNYGFKTKPQYDRHDAMKWCAKNRFVEFIDSH